MLEAAFDGKHGWFWRNRTDKPVTVTLHTEGGLHRYQACDLRLGARLLPFM